MGEGNARGATVSIIKEVTRSYNDIRLDKFLSRLIAAVTSNVSQPGPVPAEQVAQTAKTLFEQLDKSTIHQFPVTWKKILRELDLEILLPSEIRRQVEEAFARRLVDADVLKALNALKDQLTQKLNSLTQLAAGFEAIRIPDDSLVPGEVEFDVAMPRQAINDQLPGFQKELAQLNIELQVLAAVAKHSPTRDFRINSISTNDFTVALNIDVDLGELIAYLLLSLHLIKATYQKNADVVAKQLSDFLPEELRDRFKEVVNNYVESEIVKLVERLKTDEKSGADPQKVENNKGALLAALKYLMQKMEKGFNMDVRSAPPSEDEIKNEGDADKKRALEESRTRLIALQQKSANIKLLEQQSAPILNLTARDPKDGSGGGEGR